MDHWREDTLESLYSNIKRSMPRNDPGSLTTASYLDIVEYILQQNGFPPGGSSLSSDNLKNQPGNATYRLVDVAFYHPERYKEQMVEAKGFLAVDPSDGISVTSLAPLSLTCP